MADIIFREGTTDDVEELARLRWDFSPDEVAASGQSYEEFLAGFRQFLAAALGGDRWTI